MLQGEEELPCCIAIMNHRCSLLVLVRALCILETLFKQKRKQANEIREKQDAMQDSSKGQEAYQRM